MGRSSMLVNETNAQDSGANTRVQSGRSTSASAESGVVVSFAASFGSVPVVVIAPHQKDAVWIDPALITTAGFTWYGDTNVAGIDWIAIGT